METQRMSQKIPTLIECMCCQWGWMTWQSNIQVEISLPSLGMIQWKTLSTDTSCSDFWRTCPACYWRRFCIKHQVDWEFVSMQRAVTYPTNQSQYMLLFLRKFNSSGNLRPDSLNIPSFWTATASSFLRKRRFLRIQKKIPKNVIIFSWGHISKISVKCYVQKPVSCLLSIV